MTLLVALGLPTAVKFWPVLASWVTSGKKRLTKVNGMTALRVSTESDVSVVPLPGGGDWPYAASEREPVIAINSAASRVRCDPLYMALMPPFICSTTYRSFGETLI